MGRKLVESKIRKGLGKRTLVLYSAKAQDEQWHGETACFEGRGEGAQKVRFARRHMTSLESRETCTMHHETSMMGNIRKEATIS